VAAVEPDRHRPQHDVIRGEVLGAKALRAAAASIRNTGDKGLGREFAKALNAAVEPVKAKIGESAAQTMPSGFAPTLTRSLKYRRSTRTDARQATVILATYAQGKKERRDLPAMNAGELAHPVFGRVRSTRKGITANPWVRQRIRPGFFERGTEKVDDEAEKQILAVVDDFVQRLAEG
jgi:hypothetical protein